MAFRFVHTADIHLDSPLKTLALRDAELAALIGNATRRAFVRIIDLCLEEGVDALLIAGDLYDGEQTSMKTARFLAEQFRRLHQAGVRTFIIRGNHDALSKITKELVLPDSVKVFPGRAEIVEIDHAPGGFTLAIHGLSFINPQAPESLVGKFRPPVEGAVNIGLMHTSLGGSPGHDVYAPCSTADLAATGFRYWALGHLHRRSVVEGPCAIVMPGMPQGRDINEAGPKSVTLVTVADDCSIHIEERATGIARFERLVMDATGVWDWRDLASAVERTLAGARSRIHAEHLVARLRLEGATPLAWRMLRDMELLKTEADDRAATVGDCHVEALEIACTPPARQGEAVSDPLAELQGLIKQDILHSEAFRTRFSDITDEIRAQLPPEIRDALLGVDEATSREALARLAREGAENVLARLEAAGEGG